MATGPQHYRQAEELLNAVRGLNPRNDESLREIEALTARAQAHATLANAAATALNRPDGEGMVRDDYREWMRTASVKPPTGPGTSSV
ncbi:hypothetical protein ACFV16_22235 [Streptomyces massasporeus]|uniref:hypothetical protein n=1 Tax=Streptomyces massasporeus TaxID=67324 RepID=UPI00367BF67F